MDQPYAPIDCGRHDELLALATLRRPCTPEVERPAIRMPAMTGLSACTAMVLLAACDSGGGNVTRTFASPDHEYVAVLITEVGSGFPGSSCVDSVFVVPSKNVSSQNYPANSRAYVGGCHTLKMTLVDGKGVIPNGPQLRWTTPRELSIVFDPKLARHGVASFYSATSLYDGVIAIRNESQ